MVNATNGTFGADIGSMLNSINILDQGSDLIVIALVIALSLFFAKNGKLIDFIVSFVALGTLAVGLGVLASGTVVLYGLLAIALYSVFNFFGGKVFSKKEFSSAYESNRKALGGLS